MAVNAKQWLNRASISDTWSYAVKHITVSDTNRAYAMAMLSMSSLNRAAARLMHTHGSHGATDVTGFGLLA